MNKKLLASAHRIAMLWCARWTKNRLVNVYGESEEMQSDFFDGILEFASVSDDDLIKEMTEFAKIESDPALVKFLEALPEGIVQ